MTNPTTPTASPGVDYAHLPGEEQNPLMESTTHVDWGLVLLNAARHVLADTDNLVTGNVAFAPDDGGPHTAPDVMVIPGAKGRHFGRYEPGPDAPIPTVCVEIVSKSNTRSLIAARSRRLLRLGVTEVYSLDPQRDTVVRVTSSPGTENLVETNAVGMFSEGLGLSFVRTAEGSLAVCCPAGRVVHPGDDPFGWLVEEMARADAESSRADRESARADRATARAESEAARAEEATQRANEAAARTRALEAELARLQGPRDSA